MTTTSAAIADAALSNTNATLPRRIFLMMHAPIFSHPNTNHPRLLLRFGYIHTQSTGDRGGEAVQNREVSSSFPLLPKLPMLVTRVKRPGRKIWSADRRLGFPTRIAHEPRNAQSLGE